MDWPYLLLMYVYIEKCKSTKILKYNITTFFMFIHIIIIISRIVSGGRLGYPAGY